MKLDTMDICIKGMTPIIFSNPRKVNVLDKKVKEYKILSNKKKKTDKETVELLQMEWELGIYFDDELGVYIPSEMLSAAFHGAATKHKLGPKTIGVVFNHHLGFSLITNNSKSFEKLKHDNELKFTKPVKLNGKKSILCCRPIFRNWKLKFDIEIDKELIDIGEITTIFQTMGKRIGMGVWRPSAPKPGHYGKFIIESLVHIDGETNEKTILIGE